MRITRSIIVKLLGIIILCSIVSLIPNQTSATLSKIEIDINRINSNVSHNPMGMNLNFLSDTLKINSHLSKLNLGTLRFPEGELGDYYLFDSKHPEKPQVSIRDRNLWFTRRFVKSDGTWKSNLSFDNFMQICQSHNVEPFIIIGIDAIAYTGNSPHASFEEVLQAAVEWVKYANVTQGYGIKYWEIGNENDLEREYLNWTPKKYANTVIRFSQAMKKVDPSIKIGANSLSKSGWWSKILPAIENDIDFLVTHQYSWMKSYEEWLNYQWDYEYNIRYTRESSNSNTYTSNLKVNVTEISSLTPSHQQKNSTWKMLHNFEVIGNALNIERIDYLHFWISRWVEKDSLANNFSAFNSEYQILPMGYPLLVWGQFIKKQMVFASQITNIRSWASYDPEEKTLSLFLLNKDIVSQNINITLNNYMGSSQNERWVLKGATPESTDVNWQKSEPILLRGSNLKTKLEPLSVTVISFQNS